MSETATDGRGARVAAGVDWRAVATFYVLACAISWPLFWARDMRPEAWAAWGAPDVVKSWLPALGPFVAGLAARFLFRRTHPARVTPLGTSAARSLAFAAVLVVAMAVVGLPGDQPHLDGLVYSGAFIVYGVLEESGWRGFLQDAVRPLPPWQRYALIGVLWGAWHFSTFLSGSAPQIARRMAVMALIWIGGSWGIGTAVEATGSLAVAAMLHVTFNLFRSLPMATAAEIVAPCVVAWVLLFRGWPKLARAAGRPPHQGLLFEGSGRKARTSFLKKRSKRLFRIGPSR